MVQKIQNPEIKYTKLFINNEFVDSKSGKTFPTISPTTGKEITQVSESFKEDVDLAVDAAVRAFERKSIWRTMNASARGKLLNDLANLLERDISYVASLEVVDNGKPFAQAVMDVQAGIGMLRYYAGWADKVEGRTIPADGEVVTYTRVEPVGVVGIIIPWNFPLMLLCLKVSPALACGCTVIVKPAEQTPLTALYFASLVKEAKIPAGVINVVPGYGVTAGEPLVLNPKVDKITFTGSSVIGRHIQAISASTNIKRVTLELGGKSPFVVMDDADLAEAVEICHQAIFFNQGQVCCAGSRTFVHEKIYDQFVKLAVERAQKRQVGNPFADTTEQGPQIDRKQFDKILSLINTGVKEGAKLETGGKVWPEAGDGFFIQPTVFSNVQDQMTIATEEIFGPCQQILKFSTLDEVIDRANATEYGLAAGIVTKSLKNALHFINNVKAGTVWTNCYFAAGPQVPFGGYKMSGHGREGGADGLNPFCEVKTVVINLPNL